MGRGGMLLIRRIAGARVWPARFVSPAVLIPLQGLPEVASGGLAKAFAQDQIAVMRAIRFGEEPDTSCGYEGCDWWLSTREP